jgi:hypothetical protein
LTFHDTRVTAGSQIPAIVALSKFESQWENEMRAQVDECSCIKLILLDGSGKSSFCDFCFWGASIGYDCNIPVGWVALATANRLQSGIAFNIPVHHDS